MPYVKWNQTKYSFCGELLLMCQNACSTINKDMTLKARLEELHRVPMLPAVEIEAAQVVYERLLTAKSICVSAFGIEPSVDSPVLGAALAELGASYAGSLRTTARDSPKIDPGRLRPSARTGAPQSRIGR